MISQVLGGGMLQLRDDAWKLLQTVFDLDYMGAAEYEFGSLPHSLQRLSTGSCEAWSYVFRGTDIKPPYWRTYAIETLRRKEIREAREAKVKPPRRNEKKLLALANLSPISDKTVYVFGPTGHRGEEVQEMLRRIAVGEVPTKGANRFGEFLDPDPDRGAFGDRPVVGWFDLDNSLFWFLDREIWKNTVRIFTGEFPHEADTRAADAAPA